MASSAGYWDLLRGNRSFRRLWYAQVTSQLGDWLDLIALQALLLRLTGSGEAIGLLVVAQFLPGAICGPFAGVIVDRFSRRQLMLAGGAALGGLVTSGLGTDMAFILDSGSFLLSAAILASIPIRETHLEDQTQPDSLKEFREGVRYLTTHRDVALYALSKTFWSLGGGGILVVIPLLGEKVFAYGGDGALSMGILYASRGIGAGIGPVLAQQLGGTSQTFLRWMIGPGFLLMALGYAGVSQSPALGVAALAMIVAHFGASIQWVFSTTLLQLSVPHRLQGRVFAIELTLFTLATSVSSYATGLASDAGWSPQELALILGGLLLPPAVLMGWLLWPAPTVDDGDETKAPEVGQAFQPDKPESRDGDALSTN